MHVKFGLVLLAACLCQVEAVASNTNEAGSLSSADTSYEKQMLEYRSKHFKMEAEEIQQALAAESAKTEAEAQRAAAAAQEERKIAQFLRVQEMARKTGTNIDSVLGTNARSSSLSRQQQDTLPYNPHSNPTMDEINAAKVSMDAWAKGHGFTYPPIDKTRQYATPYPFRHSTAASREPQARVATVTDPAATAASSSSPSTGNAWLTSEDIHRSAYPMPETGGGSVSGYIPSKKQIAWAAFVAAAATALYNKDVIQEAYEDTAEHLTRPSVSLLDELPEENKIVIASPPTDAA